MTSVIQLSKDDLWETPRDQYRNIVNNLKITLILDVCATPFNTKCPLFFTEKQDGLSQEWDRNFFMNPPYSNVKEWVRKAYEQHVKHNVTGLALIFNKSDTIWYHKYIHSKAQVIPIQGRIRFCKNGIPGKDPAPYPSIWVLWRAKGDPQ